MASKDNEYDSLPGQQSGIRSTYILDLESYKSPKHAKNKQSCNYKPMNDDDLDSYLTPDRTDMESYKTLDGTNMESYITLDDPDHETLEYIDNVNGDQPPFDPDSDGGWAWLVLLGSCICRLLLGIVYASGVFQLIFQEIFDQTIVSTSWMVSTQVSLMGLAAPLSSFLTQRLGERRTVIVGGITAASGLGLASVAPHYRFEVFAFGIMTGVGVAITLVPAVSILNIYFPNNKNLAFGFTFTSNALAVLFLPDLILWLTHNIGWRGCMLILSGIFLHSMIAAALFRPKYPLTGKTREQRPTNCDDRTGHAPYCDIIKDPVTALLCLSLFFMNIGIFIAMVHFPSYFIASGSSKGYLENCLIAYGVSNLVCRLGFSFATNSPDVDIMTVYLSTCGLLSALYCLSPWMAGSQTGQMLFSVLFGGYGTSNHAVLVSLVAQLKKQEDFAPTIGVAYFAMGTGTLVGPPFAGWLVDVTGSYEICFYVAGVSSMCSCVLLMCLVAIAPKYQQQVPAKSVRILADKAVAYGSVD